MSANYHLWLEDQAKGPFTIGQLRAMWNSGQITAVTNYTKDAGESWHPLSCLISELEPTLNNAGAITKFTELEPEPSSKRENGFLTIVTYDPVSDTFSGSMESVVKLGVKAIQSLNWKVEYVNENIGSISFEGGGGMATAYDYSCSLGIEEIKSNTYRVIATGKLKPRGNTVFALDGGSGKKAAQKVIDRMKEMVLFPDKEVNAKGMPKGCIILIILGVIVLLLLIIISIRG